MRSLLEIFFLACYFAFSIPCYVIELIIGLFSKRARARTSQWNVSHIGMRALLINSGADVTVIGLENVPQDEPVLYVSNHRSYFDIVIGYIYAKNPTSFVAKDSMKKLPFFNAWMYLMGCQFLDRKDLRQGMQVILNSIENIKSGTNVWICPEGTRNHNDEMLPFKGGSFKIAERTGCPIVPVAFTNTDNLFENHLPWVRKAKVVVEFGKPIDVASMNRAERKKLDEKTREIIAQMLEKNKALID